MMAAIVKFIRVVFFYILYFLLCMIIVTVALQDQSVGSQMLFAFGVPILFVWWQEKRRKQKTAKILAEKELEEKARSDKPPLKPSGVERRIAAERTTTRAIAEKTRKEEQSRSKEVARTPIPKGGWVPRTETVTVAGRDIGGMVYVGAPPRLNTHGHRERCRAYINPSLSVARAGTDKTGEGMPYWPSYSDISPLCRATYLDWLASGRSDASYNPGYMFLYFYGLERRYFVDRSSADAPDIVEEVRRLCSLYHDNHSVRRYLGEFLDVAMLVEIKFEDLEPTFERQGWDLPFSLKYAIGARLDNGERLGSDWVLSWFICHPESALRTAATRCREEFMALFRVRFDARFPDGLKVLRPRKKLEATYRAASSEFEGVFTPTVNGKPVPDISGLRLPLEVAQEIADDVMDDLNKFSRFLGRNPDARGSVEAHALLPSELWQSFPSEELENLKAWAREIVTKGGFAPLANVIERLEGESSQKIAKSQLTGAADALARLGFGLAPDPRFALRSPKQEEPIVIFDLGEPVERLEEVSASYRKAVTELALGSFVAHADGCIADSERRVLEVQVDSAYGLSDQERRRLRANLEWFLAVPPDINLLRRKLKEVDEDSQTAMRAALIATTRADGIVQSEEVASVEKAYRALGLDPSLAYSDLHAGDLADAPRTVRAAQPGRPGEAIQNLEKFVGLSLDKSRIAAIRSDTERVSSVLGQIFGTGEDQEEVGVPRNQSLLQGLGLDQEHGALVQDLVEQEHWTAEAYEQLCKQHALMASGALETVNEWAFETYDEALLDEYDGYDVSPEIAKAVICQLKGEGSNVETETT